MSALDRIRGLVAKAQEFVDTSDSEEKRAYGDALRVAYDQCAGILIEEERDKQDAIPPRDEGELGDAAMRFCMAHCFHGRKSGVGEADECSICPLAGHTLVNVELVEADDIEQIERARQERAKREARQARRRLVELGVDTFAAYSNPVPRIRTVRAADPGEGE